MLLAWRGSPPRQAASAWDLCRVPGCVGWPGAALSSAGASAGSLHLFCFLVSARQPHTHPPLISRSSCVKGGESGPVGASTDQVMMCERRPPGLANADAPPVIAKKWRTPRRRRAAPTGQPHRGAAHHSHPRLRRSSMVRRRRRARAARPGPRRCPRRMNARSRRRRGPPTSSALLGDEQKRCAVPRPTPKNSRSRCDLLWTIWCLRNGGGPRRRRHRKGRRWPRSSSDLDQHPMMTMRSSLPSCMVAP